jgi:polyphosphate kinase
MSRTVSFRASEELDDFLEQEAERRMTTKSTAAQMLLAEKVRELQDERSAEPESEQVSEPIDGDANGDLPKIFQTYSERWHRPDSDTYEFAVKLPDGEGTRYFETLAGAASRLETEYPTS